MTFLDKILADLKRERGEIDNFHYRRINGENDYIEWKLEETRQNSRKIKKKKVE